MTKDIATQGARTDMQELQDLGINMTGMAPGLAIMFNEPLYEKLKQLAKVMSNAKGVTPPHLIGNGEACFAVLTRAITWKLDPFAVAQSTYQTPGGRIGFEGKLVQAILENSGHLVGPVRYHHFGDWSKVKGKFEIKKSSKGFEYPAITWTRKDAEGLGVTVSAQVKGEETRREMNYYLDEAFPLNSTLWATKPQQQICYAAVRAFANIAAPGLFLGVPFDTDDRGAMVDVTPARPSRGGYTTIEAEPDQSSSSEWYVMGREARTNGISFRDAPSYLDATQLADWQDGWKECDADYHNGGEASADDDEGSAGDVAEQAGDEAEIEQEPEVDPRAVAYEAGDAARTAGKMIEPIPQEFRADKEQTDAYRDGWRYRNNEIEKAGNPA